METLQLLDTWLNLSRWPLPFPTTAPWMFLIPSERLFSFMRNRKFFCPSHWKPPLFYFQLYSPGVHPPLQLCYCCHMSYFKGVISSLQVSFSSSRCYQSHQLFVIPCGCWATWFSNHTVWMLSSQACPFQNITNTESIWIDGVNGLCGFRIVRGLCQSPAEWHMEKKWLDFSKEAAASRFWWKCSEIKSPVGLVRIITHHTVIYFVATKTKILYINQSYMPLETQ